MSDEIKYPIKYATQYFVSSTNKTSPASADIVCPDCGIGLDVYDDEYPEDRAEEGVCKVKCAGCNKEILFEKEVKYTVIQKPTSYTII